MNRNQICNCGSEKKFKRCCGNNSINRKGKNYIILFLSIFFIFCLGYGFKKIMEKNRVDVNSNLTYCQDCGRYH